MNIVIDGVIFQIQAGRPHGISRMWRSLIPELANALPEASITILRRCGSEIPVQGLREYTIPPYCFGPNEILEADDQMLTKVCAELEASIFLSTYYTRALGVPNALFMYDMIPEIMRYNLSDPQWSAKQRAIAQAQSFFSISESTGKDLARLYNVSSERITVAHLGVAPDFRPASQSEIAVWMKRAQIGRPYFLFVGNRGLYKNGAAALQAVTRLSNSRDVDIIAVGGEPRLTPDEAKIARDLNLRIIPWLSDEELRLAYAGSLALLYPSLYEGFGLPVAEAMACGCPVITMRSSSLPEVGGDAPIYVSPDSPEEFVDALKRVQDASVRKRMAEAGVEQARLFNWKQTAQKVASALTASARKSQRGAKQSASTAGPPTLVSAVFPLNGLETSTAVAELHWLRDQTLNGDFEIIVVGNEQEIRALREAAGSQSYVELLLQPEETVLSGCNRALRQARGRYLTVGNSFAGFAKNALEAQVQWLEERPDIGLGFCRTSSETPERGGLVQLLSEGIFCSHAMWRKEVQGRAGYFNPALSYEARHEFYVRLAWSCGATRFPGKSMRHSLPTQGHQSEKITPELQIELSRSLYATRRLVPITALYPSLRNYGSDPAAWSAAWLDFGNRCARTCVPDFPLAIAAYQTALRSNGLSPEASAELHLKVGNNVGLALLLTNRIAEGQSFLIQAEALPAAVSNKQILDREGTGSLDPFSFEWAQSDHPVLGLAREAEKAQSSDPLTHPPGTLSPSDGERAGVRGMVSSASNLPDVRSGDNTQQAGSGGPVAAAAERVRGQSQSESQVRSDRVPLVSAIVSTYNSENFIRGCLQDLVGQTLYQKGLLEIIVVDSCSPQNEQAIVREFQNGHKNIRYLRTEERETIYAAWNRAIDMAQGRYITNANTDDAHRPDALERLAAALEKFPQADLAYGDYLCASVPNDRFAKANEKAPPRQPIVQPPYHPAVSMFFCPTGCHPFWRRKVFEKIGQFDSAFTSAGDYEFLLRFIKAGLVAVHVPEILSLFFQNRHGIQFRKGSKSLEEGKSIYAKYRCEMPIGRLFKVRPSDSRSESAAWTALGNLAMCHEVPWFNEPGCDLAYALFCYNKASESDPRNFTAIANQAIVALCQNEIEKAKLLLKRLPEKEIKRVQSLSDSKQLSRLVPVEVAPATPTLEFVGSCHANVAELSLTVLERNALDKTRRALEKAAQLEPENADLAESLGVVQFRLGDFTQARESFIRVTAVRSADPSAFVQLALANLRLDRVDDFESALGRAMEIDPGNTGGLKLLADIQFECGKFQEAAQAYGRIVQQEPENIEALLRLGTCFHKSGDLETAQTVFEKVLELQPENTEARENLEAVLHSNEGGAQAPRLQSLAPSPKTDQLQAPVSVGEAPTGAPEGGRAPQSDVQVSAIVSTYNSERFLRGCLQDLIDQSLYRKGQLEIVVVDSGSQQNERSIVKEFQSRFENIVYVRTEERERIYAAWNRALNIARGKYVTNANTDDRHRTDALEVMMLELERHAAVALVYADQIVTRRENQQFGACAPDGYFKWPEFDRMQLLHTPCCGPQPMWRRQLHDELGLFDGSLKVAGDYEWWLRVSSKHQFKHIPEFLGLYLLNPAGVEHGNSKEGNEETHRIRAHYAAHAGITELDYKRYKPTFLVFHTEALPSTHSKHASEITPNDASGFFQLASKHLALDEIAEFETALARALEFDPYHRDALKLLADLNFQNSQWGDAGQTYRKILTRFPNDVEALIGLGLSFVRGNELETAATVFERALEIQPENSVAKENLDLIRKGQPGKHAQEISQYPDLSQSQKRDQPETVSHHDLATREALDSVRRGIERVEKRTSNIQHPTSKVETVVPPASDPRPVTSNPAAVTELLAEADAEHQKGNLGRAQHFLLEASQIAPHDSQILASLGAVSFGLGDFESARKEFQRLVQLKPDDPSGFVQLALACLKLERIEEFESTLDRALQIDPHYREALKILADLNFQHGSLKDAAQTYSKILSRNPNDIEALHPLGVCFFKTGDFDTARSVFERVLEIDPDNSLAKENLEAIRRKTQSPKIGAPEVPELAPSIETRTLALEESAKPKPEMPVPLPLPARLEQKSAIDRVNELIDQANFFNEVGNREAALESLEQAAELSPRDAELLVSVGSLHFTLGNFEAARGHFRRIIELQPRDPGAYTRLAMVCMKVNRIEEMESALGIALEIDPNNREALKFLAKTNLENNRVRDAGRIYAKLLDKQPGDVECLLSLGLCFFRGNDRDSARMVYERVLELDPFNPTARENLIQLGHKVAQPSLSLTGTPTESTEKTHKLKEWLVKADIAFGNQDLSIAREALKAALELAPDTTDILSALGTLCYQLGDLEQARTYLRRLVHLGPDNAGDWARLALIFYHLNEIGEFEAALGRALELDPNHVESLRMLGHLNFNHGSIADAAQQYGKILKQTPDDLEVITVLGVCFFKMRDYDAAKMMFERVLELNPENALVRDNLHAVNLKLQPPEPIKQEEQIQPASAKPAAKVDKLLNEAQTLVTAGNLRKACATLRQAAELAPNDADIFATLGSFLYQLGDCQTSQEALARAVKLRPDSADFQTRSAITFLTLDKISDFESALSRALELDSDYVPALRLLADLNLQQGKYKDAADTYFRILRKDPDNVDVMLAMGVCFYKTGDVAAARLMYERALKLQPHNTVARENLEVIVKRGREMGESSEPPISLKTLLAPAAGDSKSILSAAQSEESFRATPAPAPGAGTSGVIQPSIEEHALFQTPIDSSGGASEKATKAETAMSSVSGGAEPQPASGTLHLVWEGSQFVHHSLALINRELCLRLLAKGHDLSILPFETDQFGPEADPRFRQLASRFRAALSQETQVHVRHQWPLNSTAPKQGYWVIVQPWEFGSLPKEWLNLFQNQVDEVWVPSSFVRTCYIQSGVPADKVFVVPNGMDPAKFHPGASPMLLATKKKFKFLFVGGTIHRKGPDLLLQAYLQRFSAADDVCLVIKDFGGDTVYQGQTIAAKVREIQTNPRAPEILYLTQDLPPDTLPGLYTACDCLVHPYRGEGFGLPILEAMACGLAVITTGGGASDDFATAEFAYRIPASRKSIGSKIGAMELVGEGWLLEPDLASLSERIAFVFQQPEAARALGRKASEHAHTKWTWELAATKAEERLRKLAARSEGPIRMRAPQKSEPPKTELPPIATLASLKKVHELLQRKKYLKAWNAALEAISLRAFHPDAYLQMVEIALAAEDERQALLCSERLLHLTPNWDMARKIHSAMKPLKKGKRSKIKWTPLPVLPPKPRLSVCLIVKNEERFIAQCLASVKPMASQIVVVDTGSTDRTVEIAKEYGAEVHHFPWNDNFSDARNAAHEHARGDWVLILDADEEMPAESHLNLAQDMAVANVLGYRIPICNLHEAPDSVTYVPRLFRNAPAFFFVGRVHEQIYASVTARTSEWGMEAKMGTATIVHHGYDPEVIRQRGKVKRNLRLMARAVEEIPNEAALLMNYGLDLVNDGRLDEGYERYRQAVAALEKADAQAVLPEVRERLVTVFGSHLVRGGRMEELFEVMTSKLARDSGPTASMHFLAGLALMKQKRFTEAIVHYRTCLAKRHFPALTPPCAGVMTAGPHHLLAECLNGVGQHEEAEKEFKAAMEQDPRAGGIIHDYAYFLHGQNRSLEAIQLLHGAIGKDINEERIWQLGGYISNSKPDFLEFALDWTAEALKFYPEHNAINGFRGETLLKAGRLDEALSFLERKEQASTATGQAAIILCRLATRENAGMTISPDQEPVLSREFLGWYRRLLATNAKEAIQAVNARLDRLQRELPTAASLLKAALKESKPP